jgi:hypothetical protein
MVPRVRRFDPVAARSPARHAAGGGQFHHEVAESRARSGGVAGGDGGHDRGRDAWRTTMFARIGVMQALNRNVAREVARILRDPG